MTVAAAVRAPVDEVKSSVFEGMFTRALKPDAALREKLKVAGFDSDHVLDGYPRSVWRACVEVARQHLYADLSIPDGERKLGGHFVEGFFQTIVGRVMAVGFSAVGITRILQRIPRYAMALGGNDIKVILAGTTAMAHFTGAYHPHFVAGALETGLSRAHPSLKVEVVRARASSFDLRLTWTA